MLGTSRYEVRGRKPATFFNQPKACSISLRRFMLQTKIQSSAQEKADGSGRG
jgi:hypothetical protein